MSLLAVSQILLSGFVGLAMTNLFSSIFKIHLKQSFEQIKIYMRINERKSEQAQIPHAPTKPANAVYNEWQFKALVMGNRTENAYLQIMSFTTIKFHQILLSHFSGVVLIEELF